MSGRQSSQGIKLALKSALVVTTRKIASCGAPKYAFCGALHTMRHKSCFSGLKKKGSHRGRRRWGVHGAAAKYNCTGAGCQHHGRTRVTATGKGKDNEHPRAKTATNRAETSRHPCRGIPPGHAW